MTRFFIDRPVLAWVTAIFIMLAGVLALPALPVSQYPNVAPPKVNLSTSYAGASPDQIYQSVTRVIEDAINSTPGLIYFESSSDASGRVSINATFRPGTNVIEAAMDAQNRVRRIEGRLPQAVVQQGGIRVEPASADILMVVALRSTDGAYDSIALGDFLDRNIMREIQRVEGVGPIQLIASPRAMRVWIDPGKMLGLGLTTNDVMNAIRTQNAQVAAGRIGAEPSVEDNAITASVVVHGQLSTVEEFGAITLRANPDGSTVRLRDVARIEIGGENYSSTARLDGQAVAAIGVQLHPTGNAVSTAAAVRERMSELSRSFPAGITYDISFDSTPFVGASIDKVVMTLLEAMGLVFLVMLLFLKSFRCTVIPALVVPVALLGTCAMMFVTGFSVNVLTMFAMVLVIGILVDDAIIVVENVERIMAEERLSPREATHKAMGQIGGAIVGITLILTAVFVPMAFFPGAVGVIYRQFSLTMVVSILFSGFLALTFTPALCASLLRPPAAGHHAGRGLFGWFDRFFKDTTNGYVALARRGVRKTGRMMVIYAALAAGAGWAFMQLPTSFLPVEDRGTIMVDIIAPTEASARRTELVIRQMEEILRSEPAIARVSAQTGGNLAGSGQNVSSVYLTLKDWSERAPEDSAQAIVHRLNEKFFTGIKDAQIYAMLPPSISGLSSLAGIDFRLEDRAGRGQDALVAAWEELLAAAAGSDIVTDLRVVGMPAGQQLNLMIDREKANAFGVSFADINSTISTNLGSAYANDFPNAGRMQRVTVQADSAARMLPGDLMTLSVRNASGGMVPLSAFMSVEWSMGPTQITGYNGYQALRISGQAKPGHSSGDAIAEMERLAAKLPEGFGYDWTGESLQEVQAGAQAPLLIALSVLFVFLLLAALYESWFIPVSVMLAVPLGAIGSIVAVMMRGMDNDVYFLVGFITIIGLSAKNAILIVEFARHLLRQGVPLRDAAVEALRIRFRPIVMTSLAFMFGVLPLAVASGAGSAGQNAIGTGVLGGMISATVLVALFTPVFFVFLVQRRERKHQPVAEPGGVPAAGE
jgi:multidrug efflux pump